MNWSDPALPEALHGFALLACGDAAAARQEAELILAARRRLTYEEAALEVVLMVDALVELRDAEGLRAFLPKAEGMRQAIAVLGPAIDRAAGLFAETLPADERAPVLDAALRQYEQLGATPHAERARATKVAGGV